MQGARAKGLCRNSGALWGFGLNVDLASGWLNGWLRGLGFRDQESGSSMQGVGGSEGQISSRGRRETHDCRCSVSASSLGAFRLLRLQGFVCCGLGSIQAAVAVVLRIWLCDCYSQDLR